MGIITDIQRFSVHDGPGIRTTVFFKGCPLRCKWCHNPETQSPLPQPQLNKTRCIGCKACEKICPRGCHKISDLHIFDSTNCVLCFGCVEACRFSAIERIGYEISAPEVVKAALRDKAFYAGEGGITLSGGEPTMQPAFCNDILALAVREGLDTCIETCGYSLDKIDLSLCSHIYFDIKASTPELYREFTGNDGVRILENLAQASKLYRDRITLRTVIVRGLTDSDEHIAAIKALAAVNGIERVEALPFHPYGSSKAEAIGRPDVGIGKEGMVD